MQLRIVRRSEPVVDIQRALPQTHEGVVPVLHDFNHQLIQVTNSIFTCSKLWPWLRSARKNGPARSNSLARSSVTTPTVRTSIVWSCVPTPRRATVLRSKSITRLCALFYERNWE